MVTNLKGRLILDCSTLLPGPFLGKLLASKGARVIKVENPLKPDGAKFLGSAYSDLNDCKEKVFFNLMMPEDRSRFHDLIKQADGLIEGFRPQAKIKLGLDEQTLHSIQPKLCIASLVGYPEEGSWKNRAGHDLNFQAVTGCLSLSNEMPSLPLADLFSAYEGAFSLTAALDAVARGGQGSRVVISMSETLKTILSHLVREFRDTGVVPSPGKTLFSGSFPCYRIYSTQDGRRVSVGAIESKFWVKVCEIIGRPELASEGYASGGRGLEVIQSVQTSFSSKPWSVWAALFDKADCCVEPILDFSEIYSRGL